MEVFENVQIYSQCFISAKRPKKGSEDEDEDYIDEEMGSEDEEDFNANEEDDDDYELDTGRKQKTPSK